MKVVVLYISLFVFAYQLHAQKNDFASISFKKADSLAMACKNEQLTNIPLLVNKLTTGLTTDAERFRALYVWVCTNIANSYSLYTRNMGKRHKYENDSLQLAQWNQKFSAIALKKLIKKKKTICTGYSYLLQQMAAQAGITCHMVNGYARTSTINTAELTAPNHSWNAVLLNGKWYLCDPTWAAGIPDPTTNLFTFEYNDGFFLAEPALFAINHYPTNPKWLLLPYPQPSFTNFLEAPILYGGAYSTLTQYQQPAKMHYVIKKTDSIAYTFTLQQPTTANNIHLVIDSGYSTHTVHPNSTITNNHVNTTYTFNHKGFYDVHLYINNQLIATHTVKVE